MQFLAGYILGHQNIHRPKMAKIPHKNPNANGFCFKTPKDMSHTFHVLGVRTVCNSGSRHKGGLM